MSSGKEPRFVAVMSLAAAFAAAGFHLAYASYGNLTQDEAWLLECAARVGSGQVAHRDFVSIYPPGQFHLAQVALDAAGGDARAVRWMWAILRGVVVGLTLALGRRLMPWPWAAAAAIAVVLMPGPWHKTFYALVPLAVLLAAARALVHARLAGFVWSGVLAGIGFWFRHDVALFAWGAAGLLPLLHEVGSRRRAWAEALRRMACVAVGGLAGATAAGWYFVGGIEPRLWIEQLFLRAMQEGHGRIDLMQVAAASGGWPALALPLVAFASAGGWLVYLVAQGWRQPWDRRAAVLAMVAVFSLLAANQVVRISMVARFLQGGPVVFSLWFAAVAELVRRMPRLGGGLALFGVLAPLALTLALWRGWDIGLPAEYAGTAALRFSRPVPFRLPHGGTIYVEPQWAGTVGRFERILRSLPDDGGPTVVFGWPAGLLHLTQRRNPTRLIRFEEESVTPAEREEAWQTIRHEARFIFIDRRYLTGRAKSWWPLVRRDYRVRWDGARFQVWELRAGSNQRRGAETPR